MGERLAVVGDVPELGQWKVDHGLRLQWTTGNIWRGEVILPKIQKILQYKYVVFAENGAIRWESASNHHATWNEQTGSILECNDCWEQV